MVTSPFLVYMERSDAYIERYKELGCAIIQQAVDDYYEDILSLSELYHFLYHTEWIQCLDIDVDFLFDKVRCYKDGKKKKQES